MLIIPGVKSSINQKQMNEILPIKKVISDLGNVGCITPNENQKQNKKKFLVKLRIDQCLKKSIN